MKKYETTRPAKEFMLVLPLFPVKAAEYLEANYEKETADDGPLKMGYVVSREDCDNLPIDCSFQFYSIRRDGTIGDFITDFWDGDVAYNDVRYEMFFRG